MKWKWIDIIWEYWWINDKINPAHQTHLYLNKGMKPLVSFTDIDKHYCQISADKSIAICEGFHSDSINEVEQKLIISSYECVFHMRNL